MSRNPRFSKQTIDEYCFFSIRNFEEYDTLSDGEKKKAIEDRIERLEKIEWQRWVPLWGIGRRIYEGMRSDYLIYEKIHSPIYENLNIIYNTLTLPAVALGAELLAMKLLT